MTHATKAGKQSPAPPNAGEPLDDLRQKLAQRLGSKLGPGGQLQVSTKAASAEAQCREAWPVATRHRAFQAWCSPSG